jgi:hypothetical protein
MVMAQAEIAALRREVQVRLSQSVSPIAGDVLGSES